MTTEFKLHMAEVSRMHTGLLGFKERVEEATARTAAAEKENIEL